MAKRTKLLIADDHELVRRGVRELLDAQPDFVIVAEADTVAGAIAAAKKEKPDVAILDVQMPDGSGVDACREIHKQVPGVRVVMLSAYADERAFAAALEAGAAGYLLKRAQAEELTQAIRRVAAGESILDPELTERLTAKANDSDRGDPRLSRLSPQEMRVLELISQGRTNREIGEDLYLAEKTVKNYVSNLLAKLEMSNRSEAAAYAARLGAGPSEEDEA